MGPPGEAVVTFYSGQESGRRSGHWVARLALLCVVAATFTLAVSLNASQQKLSQGATYRQALADENAYQRLYDQVLFDPALKERTDQLLGGVHVPTEDVRTLVERIVPPDQLQKATEAAIDPMVASLRSGGRLRLAVDVTPFIRVAVTTVIQYAVDKVSALPVRKSLTYPLFVAELTALMAGLQRGDIPSYIPTFSAAPIDISSVASIILQASGVTTNTELGKAVNAALAGGDVAAAVKAATATILLARASANLDLLISSLETGPNGEILLAASPSATDRIENTIWPARLLLRVAGPGRFVAAIVAVVALGALAWLERQRPWHAVAWCAGAIAAGGVAALQLWLLGGRLLPWAIERSAVKHAPGFPQTFASLVHDVVSAVLAQTNALYLVPGTAAALAGGLGLLLSLMAIRSGNRQFRR